MGKRVLIVDDAVFMRMKLRDILEKNGYEVIAEAKNGIDAIEKFKQDKPDLITMDITMPEMDGVSALKAIRTLDTDARVIMCSAMGQQSMVMEAIQSGALDFIVKPFDTDRVIQSLERVMR